MGSILRVQHCFLHDAASTSYAIGRGDGHYAKPPDRSSRELNDVEDAVENEGKNTALAQN